MTNLERSLSLDVFLNSFQDMDEPCTHSVGMRFDWRRRSHFPSTGMDKICHPNGLFYSDSLGLSPTYLTVPD